MKRALLSLLLVVSIANICGRAVAQSAAKSSDEKSGLSARTAGLARHDGFFPYYWDEKKGDILFELSPETLKHEFLYFTGLGSGIGSIEAFADRSSFGGQWVCRFRRVGMRLLVDSGEHQLCRSERLSGIATFRGIQLSDFRAGVSSYRSRAERDGRWSMPRRSWCATLSICCHNSGVRLAPWEG